MKIGFVGLGNMGAAIATNLIKAGHAVTVWNRSSNKAQALVAAGATLAASPKAAAAASEAVFTMLADDAALQSTMQGADGILEGLARERVHVSMSTIAVASADQWADEHARRQQRFVCAPVFGRPEAAAAAKLFIVAAGETGAVETVAPAFTGISQRVFRVGERPSAANLVKLCGNFMILAAIEALGEAVALAQKGGVAPRQLLEVLTGSLFDAPVYKTYGGIIVEQKYKPAGFTAPLGLKDMKLVGASADTLRVPMPVLSVLRDHLLQTIAQRGDDTDWSGIAASVAHNAGITSSS